MSENFRLTLSHIEIRGRARKHRRSFCHELMNAPARNVAEVFRHRDHCGQSGGRRGCRHVAAQSATANCFSLRVICPKEAAAGMRQREVAETGGKAEAMAVMTTKSRGQQQRRDGDWATDAKPGMAVPLLCNVSTPYSPNLIFSRP